MAQAIRLFTLVIALTGAVAPAWAAGPQGVTDTEIVVGTHQDLSGPIAFWGVPVRNGMQMAADEINASGGIHGRKIKLVVEDSGYDPKKAVLATQKMLSRDNIFIMAGAMGTPTVLATMPLVLQKGLPHVFPLTSADQMYEPYDKLKFALFTPYTFAMRVATKWFVETKHKKAVCVLHQDDEFGLNVKRGVEEQLHAMKLTLVSTTTYKRGATDFSSQIAKLRADKCDLVALGTVIRETVGAMAEAKKLGWQVDMVGSQAAYAPEVAGLGKDVVEGLYAAGQTPIPYYDGASPQVKAWLDNYKAKFNADGNIQSVAGYDVVMVMAEGLKHAGKNLTADSFVEGLHKVKSYSDIFGGAPVSFSPGNHLATKSAFVAQIKSGRWVTVTDHLAY
ncbi:MAG: ABC transporter substrate-binding protein [Acidobacteriia bacterium]|nr:ABC transporter substrate-binding protein [Terriglobia bacterium]